MNDVVRRRPYPETRPATGAFVDRALEAEFQHDQFDSLRRFTRFSIGLSTAAFLEYGLHDLFLLGALRDQAWAIRYGVFGPIGLGVVAFTWAPAYARWHQAAMLLFGLALNVVVFWIGALAEPAGFFIYTGYAILFVTLGPFIARMNVITQLVYTAASIALFLGFSTALSHPAAAVEVSIATTLAAMGGIGATVARQLESQARRMFLQRKTIREQLVELDAERAKSEALLLNILPSGVATRLKADGQSIADAFAEVTVLFADIVGFTSLSQRLSPVELVRRLNELFSMFDDLADEFAIEKIKTIGDAYMAVAGLNRQDARGVQAMADMALGMLTCVEKFSRKYEEPLSVRIGLNCGPVVAGVIGKKKFIYDVWGDTVNTASRMESHGSPGHVHVTEDVARRLEDSYALVDRGEIEVKGKGTMRTFYLGAKKKPGVAVASISPAP